LSVQHGVIATPVSTKPQLFFFSEASGAELLQLIEQPQVLDILLSQNYGLVVSVAQLDHHLVQAIRTLNAQNIPLIAWLLLPPEQGFALNLQNYPQVCAHYETFREWAKRHSLDFQGVGLEIDVVPSESLQSPTWELRELLRRMWLANENVLYPAARAAYVELVGMIRHDGYEVHSYQLPLIADERSIGTTLLQRALDIMDLPTDLEVLVCSSCVSTDHIQRDLEGALIRNYGSQADAIAIGTTDDDGSGDRHIVRLEWPAIKRDLLLASRYSDTIFIFSFEDCVRRNVLPQIAALNWLQPARASNSKYLLLKAVRLFLRAILVIVRFGPWTIAWAGWGVALWFWWSGFRYRKKTAKITSKKE
jgi:hypothetical protein